MEKKGRGCRRMHISQREHCIVYHKSHAGLFRRGALPCFCYFISYWYRTMRHSVKMVRQNRVNRQATILKPNQSNVSWYGGDYPHRSCYSGCTLAAGGCTIGPHPNNPNHGHECYATQHGKPDIRTNMALNKFDVHRVAV